MLGTIGQLLIYLSLVSCIIGGIAFFRSATRPEEENRWKPVSHTAWILMTVAVLAVSGILAYLILTHQFEYNYVYKHSSKALPLDYLFSSLWAGQEGSFLLWIIFNAFAGVALLFWAKRYQAPVMSIISLCQFFLLSMILGAQFGPLHIGSSPFITLAEKYPEAPMLQAGFVPPDGQGLNDLLQNYWMVIHPPTLFVGFSLMIVPFAYAIAGLWKKWYTQWVKPALPWALAANVILFIGISMGGYWAYETLSFGGYWAWDPVENSSLVPWLIGVAGIHAMVAQKKSSSNHKAALFLNILAYLLVVYSTFLTRSGILGDISVHSFVDLGLYNQLLIWIGTMGLVGFGLFAYRYKELPRPDREPRVLSREFMIFTGAMILCALGAVITVGTSSPIIGELFRENPSGVPISFYNRWTLPLSIVLALLAGLGQLFWWNKMDIDSLNRVLIKPLALSIAGTTAVLLFTPFVAETVNAPAMMTQGQEFIEAGITGDLGAFWSTYGTSLLLLLLVFSGFFAFFGNSLVLMRVWKGNPKMAGGAVAHLGLALMIFGVISSSGFTDPISEGQGVRMASALEGTNRDNFVISQGETRQVDGFTVTYEKTSQTPRGRKRYHISMVTPEGRQFSVRPVTYENDQGQWIQHPDIQTYFEKDFYVAVAPSAMFQSDSDSTGMQEVMMSRGDSATLGYDEYRLKFNGFDPTIEHESIPDSAQIAVAANLTLTKLETGETRTLRPVYLIMRDRSQQFIQNRVPDWDISITFAGMKVESGSARLLVEGARVNPRDWLVIQAYEKPFINLLWIGILMMAGGFGMAIFRRIGDVRSSRKRGLV